MNSSLNQTFRLCTYLDFLHSGSLLILFLKVILTYNLSHRFLRSRDYDHTLLLLVVSVANFQ